MISIDQAENPLFGEHDWILGEVSTLVEWRATIYAKPGDVVLLAQDPAGVVSFYSIREACLCVAGAGIRPSMGWNEAFDYWRNLAGKDPATWIVAEPEEEEPAPVSTDWEPPVPEDSEVT